MPVPDKRSLSERDICSKFITPALIAAGWDFQAHIREEVSLTKGRVIVRGRMTTRGELKRALVDALEQQLAASRATAEKLLTALVAELTGQSRDPTSVAA